MVVMVEGSQCMMGNAQSAKGQMMYKRLSARLNSGSTNNSPPGQRALRRVTLVWSAIQESNYSEEHREHQAGEGQLHRSPEMKRVHRSVGRKCDDWLLRCKCPSVLGQDTEHQIAISMSHFIKTHTRSKQTHTKQASVCRFHSQIVESAE